MDITKRKLEFRPWPKRGPFANIRDYAITLMLRVDYIDEDGRHIGFNYGHILQAIHTRFPIVTYNGPHKGQPSRMTYDNLWEIARNLNHEGIVLPVRPRRKKPKIKTLRRRRKKSKVNP